MESELPTRQQAEQLLETKITCYLHNVLVNLATVTATVLHSRHVVQHPRLLQTINDKIYGMLSLLSSISTLTSIRFLHTVHTQLLPQMSSAAALHNAILTML